MNSGGQPATVGADHLVPSGADSNLRIHLRERLPAGTAPGTIGRAVLFVHGATLPGAQFDLAVAGYSWLADLAQAGFAAYAMDVRGYGGSTRPPSMEAPPGSNRPFARAAEAVEDIDGAVSFILSRTAARQVHIVGQSWGTATAGRYAASKPQRVARLALVAPIYSYRHAAWLAGLADPSDSSRLNPAIGAYRTTTGDEILARWGQQIPGADKSLWRDPEVAAALVVAALASDPASSRSNPPLLRAPNGVLADLFEIFNERPIYDAAKVTMPTLLIRGDADTDATRADGMGLFDRLAAPVRRYVEIAGASHFLNLERSAATVHRVVREFFEEGQAG